MRRGITVTSHVQWGRRASVGTICRRIVLGALLLSAGAAATAAQRDGHTPPPADSATAKGITPPYVFADSFESLRIAFTSAEVATFRVGQAGSFTIATDTPASLELLGSLPAGLSFTAATGVLTGTPQAGSGGSRTLQITARTATGQRVQVFTLRVEEAPVVTSTSTLTCTVGAPCTFSLAASGFPAPAFSLPGLPTGLGIDTTTGALSGMAAVGSGGVHTLTASATNVAGSAMQPFTLTINEAPSFTSAASASCTVGSACSVTLVATGFPAPAFSLPGLPSGLSIDPASGVVSGTAAAGSGGVRALTATASNLAGSTPQSFTLTLTEAPTITASSSASCTVGAPCSLSVSASGFPAPTFSLPGLPDGLSVDPTSGQISGTPAAATGGVRNLTLGASNTAGSATQPFALTINEAPGFTSAASASCTVGSACTFTLVATGFPAPTFNLPGLPSGLSLDPVSGVVSGTAAAGSSGVRALTATASNANGSTPRAFSLTVNEAPAITSANSRSCQAGVGCVFQFAASGFPAPTYSLPGLPAGLTLDAASGALSGTPALGSEGSYALTLSASNGIGTAATQAFALQIAAATLQITAVNPATLVPGGSATLTGVLFDPVPANNTVTIDGVAMTVNAATTTSLSVTVPCVASGTLPLRVQVGAATSPDFPHPLQGNLHTLQVGDAVVVSDPAKVACTELAATNQTTRYVVTVFSNSTSPSSNAPVQLFADAADDAPPLAADKQARAVSADVLQYPSPYASKTELEEQAADVAHLRVLEANEREYARLFERFHDDARMNRDPATVSADPVEPPLTRTFRISNIFSANICANFYVVAATRVYYDGKIAIYEDDATPTAFKAANSAIMASNYQRIGDQFNADMEPIVRQNFGDIIRRDPVTDNNGVLVALFTPNINANAAGVAGFVVSCDQFPNDDTATPGVGGPYTTTGGINGASNFGEFFYAYQPAVDAAGYSGNTPENWYRTIRSTFIHESKHVASQAARVANGAPSYEQSWLEEGTARHSEELWMRNAVDLQGWKTNIGYGSAADPINLYCDARPSGFPECDANTRRPANIMARHFTSLYTNLFGLNARLLSPFGATASDNASYFYAISWSLVRYAIDRYGSSDAEFLTALTQANVAGVDNLLARSGVGIDELLGGWLLSLVADDYPGLAVQNPAIQMPSWNFRGIYGGLNADFPGTYTLGYPQVPASFGFGSFTATTATTLRGGGALWYQLSGTQTAPQLLKLRGNGGAALPASVRIAVARVE
jgi:hypothetical protein